MIDMVADDMSMHVHQNTYVMNIERSNEKYEGSSKLLGSEISMVIRDFISWLQ